MTLLLVIVCWWEVGGGGTTSPRWENWSRTWQMTTSSSFKIVFFLTLYPRWLFHCLLEVCDAALHPVARRVGQLEQNRLIRLQQNALKVLFAAVAVAVAVNQEAEQLEQKMTNFRAAEFNAWKLPDSDESRCCAQFTTSQAIVVKNAYLNSQVVCLTDTILWICLPLFFTPF